MGNLLKAQLYYIISENIVGLGNKRTINDNDTVVENLLMVIEND
jgi:hypothetical protein